MSDDDPSDVTELRFLAEAPPVRIAGAVRRMLEREGYGLVPRGRPTPPAALELHIRPRPGTGGWLHFRDAEAVPDAFAIMLSSILGADVTAILWAPPIIGYERTRSGRSVEKLVIRGDEILEQASSSLGGATDGAGSLRARLLYDGFEPMTWSQAQEGRGMSLVLAGRGRGSEDELVVAADVQCPLCNGPVVARKGRYGSFLGCLQYPTCRGKVKLSP